MSSIILNQRKKVYQNTLLFEKLQREVFIKNQLVDTVLITMKAIYLLGKYGDSFFMLCVP
jgi:hypothetical protein